MIFFLIDVFFSISASVSAFSNEFLVTKTLRKFQDVAGMEEEKNLLNRFIDFLQDPVKYHNAGATIPKGVLLYGPPGTGKTLLAKSLAGEAGVPFYACSGTDFLKRIHGDGAAAVRKLFKEAHSKTEEQKQKGSIIFIDEIDSFGNIRNEFNSKEKEILTTFLTEMDGFKSNDFNNPVIVIAATNRKDVLDEALLRPGRFDYHVNVALPNEKDREAILKFHAKNKKFADNIDLNQLAKQTSGMSGAQLAAVLNEAAILQVTKQEQVININNIIQAKENILLGISKFSNPYNEQEKEIVTTHQSAKLIIGYMKKSHFLSLTTLTPHSNDKLLTLFAKEENSNFVLQNTLLQDIIVILTGKAAEEVICLKSIDKSCLDFVEAACKAKELIRFFEYRLVSDKDKENFQKEIMIKCFSDAKSWVYCNQSLIKDLAKKLQNQEITTVNEIQFFLKSKDKDFINCNNVKDDNVIFFITFFSEKSFVTFLFTFLVIFAVFMLLIIIIRIICWFFVLLTNTSWIFKKKTICIILVFLSLLTTAILFLFNCHQYLFCWYLPKDNSETITLADLLRKIDNYEIKKMSYAAKNNWLEGFYYYVKLTDKNGLHFHCKIKFFSQNIFEQRIASLQFKDFDLKEESYFNGVNLLIKIMLFLSSFVFMLYGCFNVKRIRKQLQKTR